MLGALRDKINSKQAKIAVMGLGYVGLPLAVNFAQKGFSRPLQGVQGWQPPDSMQF